MGWTTQHRQRGTSDREFFQELLGDRYEIVECASKERREFYAATRCRKTGKVDCFVALMSWSRGFYNFGYKDMSESMGPVIDRCPRRVLEALDPLEDLYPWDGKGSAPYAYEWRERCWKNVARADQASKIRPGDLVVFDYPIDFSDGAREDKFVFVSRSTLRRHGDGAECRIRSWRKRAFSVESKGITS